MHFIIKLNNILNKYINEFKYLKKTQFYNEKIRMYLFINYIIFFQI